ncbi:acyl-CoA dehydrogenase family protein [Streptomyces sp. NPDC052610]|uniref:acyl-CoA dehydrogenase family protein n=1 Tax=Streptomyces sp. NPDC052610 TaxID=3154952 RepID=UPI00342E40CE
MVQLRRFRRPAARAQPQRGHDRRGRPWCPSRPCGRHRTREQFGRPIGAFQAVQHLCAELLVRLETARAAVYAAAVTADPADIAAARLLADEAAVRGARDCLQVHGGNGIHLGGGGSSAPKRAWVRAQRGGGGTESEELLAAGLLMEAG